MQASQEERVKKLKRRDRGVLNVPARTIVKKTTRSETRRRDYRVKANLKERET